MVFAIAKRVYFTPTAVTFFLPSLNVMMIFSTVALSSIGGKFRVFRAFEWSLRLKMARESAKTTKMLFAATMTSAMVSSLMPGARIS